MIDIGPVPIFEHTTGEVTFPIVRDVDTNMYERQHGTGFGSAPMRIRRPHGGR
jgi:hypothetical protein